jgi:hypothetical protein
MFTKFVQSSKGQKIGRAKQASQLIQNKWANAPAHRYKVGCAV